MINAKTIEELVDALEMTSTDCSAYMNRKTCEIYFTTGETNSLMFDSDEDLEDSDEDMEDEVGDMEDDDEDMEDDDEDMPDWQREEVLKLREIEGSDDWIPLPSAFHIHEWAIMRDYAQSLKKTRLKDELLESIHRKGAFGAFKMALSRHGLDDEWFAFKRAALSDIVVDWLESHGIEVENR